MTVDRHRPSRWRIVLPIMAVLIGSLLSAGSAAAGNGTTVVRGVQLAPGTCPNGGYAMTGSLDGCWWIDTFNSKSDPAKTNFRLTGDEHFEGCMGTICGSFKTTYTFTGKAAGPWTTSAEIHGRCHHPIVPDSGTGGFEGATGVFSFHDVVDVSPPYYPYVGNIHLAGGSASATSLKASATVASSSLTVAAC
jgi:hypothetical protein